MLDSCVTPTITLCDDASVTLDASNTASWEVSYKTGVWNRQLSNPGALDDVDSSTLT